jgi:hypothetical protein
VTVLVDELIDMCGDLSLQRRREHPARAGRWASTRNFTRR